MTKFVSIWGAVLGALTALHGCVLATTGVHLFPATTRRGSQLNWSALVGAFGQDGASLVSGCFWFAAGAVIVYACVAPRRSLAAPGGAVSDLPMAQRRRRSKKRKSGKRA